MGRLELGDHHPHAERGKPELSPDSETNLGPRCLVIMYHYVRPHDQLEAFASHGTKTGFQGPTPDEFRLQLELLCRTMEPIDWPTFYAWQRGLSSIPGRCFLTTFDDGLADHARHAVPVLGDLGLRGVFFVPGEVLTNHRLLSAHAIHLLLSRLDDATFEQELLQEVGRIDRVSVEKYVSFDTSTAHEMYHYESPQRARLKYLLTAMLPIDLRLTCVQNLFERHIGSSSRWARTWYLNWEDLAQMQSDGHTIGGHGFGHEPLTRLTPSRQREDLQRVAAVLRDGLGPDLRPLSYPYGSYNGETATACYKAGFTHAFTTERRWATRGEDVYRVPRFDCIDVPSVLDKEHLCPAT